MRKWTPEEHAIVRSNMHLTAHQISAKLKEQGFNRTPYGVEGKLYNLRQEHRPPSPKRPDYRALYQGGWPAVPDPEIADDIFVRTVLREMLADVRRRAA